MDALRTLEHFCDANSELSVLQRMRILTIWWTHLSDEELLEFRANGWTLADVNQALLGAGCLENPQNSCRVLS